MSQARGSNVVRLQGMKQQTHSRIGDGTYVSRADRSVVRAVAAVRRRQIVCMLVREGYENDSPDRRMLVDRLYDSMYVCRSHDDA